MAPEVRVSAPTDSPAPVAHKFGGTSLADAGRIRHVAEVMIGRDDPGQVIVVSAMRGVTDELIALGERAAGGDDGWRDAANALRQRHADTANALLGDAAAATQDWLDREFDALDDVLHAVALVGATSTETMAFVQGLGEVFSSVLLCETFRRLGHDAEHLDARDVLVVRHEELGIAVDWDETGRRLGQWRAQHEGARVVVTGFVARDPLGHATTLGRNGSDYSSAIFGALFGASEIEIWTDVDGVLSADPRLVPEAVLLSRLSYDEACELAYFGAKVIHPQTMAPAIARGIPIRIRNTFRPDHPGTVIARRHGEQNPVAGLTTIDDMALVNVEGAGMIGVPGTAERVFGALHRAGISVVMISQGSSEHSICCVIAAEHKSRAVTVLREAFARELDRGHIHDVTATTGISILAAVGDGMAGTPGISARLFAALGRSRINVRAIAQGASERNISVAIASSDAERALRAVHAGFYLSPQTLSIGIVGPGHVGRALLDQIRDAQPRLRAAPNLDLRVRGIATSRRMLLCDRGIDLGCWRERFDREGEALDFAKFTAHVHAPHIPHAVIADCSASGEVAELYPAWCEAGVHVITPNKQAGSGELSRYRHIRAACASSGARFRYEATVGAGLPILQTLRDLIDTGDEIIAIEGILSGTLAYLFRQYTGADTFAHLVAAARENGYTEPDPRDDLSGTDVARKLVILGREMGRELSMADVEVENLVPAALRDCDRATFLGDMQQLDAAMAERLHDAMQHGKVLRYTARLQREGAPKVGLVECALDHPFAHIRPTDNIVQFTTRRYFDSPLVVQGPGAGPEVTAAGVFADLLRVGAAQGARL